MSPSIPSRPPVGDDLLDLRRAIGELADRCGIDLSDDAALRRVLDGEAGDRLTAARNAQDEHELSAMLTLLLRLETSSSEDLGISGLRRLWRAHATTLANWRARLAGTPQLAAG
jgi:hypothetical protein